MITYERDLNKHYNQAIMSMIRDHNKQYTQNTVPSSLYVYLIEDDELIGGLSVTYFWDWVSLGILYYSDIHILKSLIHHLWSKFKEDAVGMSAFTTIKGRYLDLEKAGFKLDKGVKINQQDTYYYMTFDQTKPIKDYSTQLIASAEPIDIYHTQLNEKTAIFNLKHHIVGVTDTFDMIVKDGNICIGGVQSDAYGDMLYVSRIAVLPIYRHQKIGSTLMNYVIQYARDINLKYVVLGTTDFQARDFYEKLGFKVVYMRPDNPKGYHSYTMIKMI
jgi:GNAT superfamily N-acetyltransferase